MQRHEPYVHATSCSQTCANQFFYLSACRINEEALLYFLSLLQGQNISWLCKRKRKRREPYRHHGTSFTVAHTLGTNIKEITTFCCIVVINICRALFFLPLSLDPHSSLLSSTRAQEDALQQAEASCIAPLIECDGMRMIFASDDDKALLPQLNAQA